MFERLLPAVSLEAFWMKASRALMVVIVVEGLALVATLLLRRRLATALARGGGLDGAFRLERRRRVAQYAALTVRWGLWSIGLLMVLDIFGVKTAPILVVLGATAALVAAASWRVLSDVVAGFFLLLDDALAVGDTVTINGTTGRVEELASRWVRVLDDQGGSHFIFNSAIRELVNHSRAPRSVRPE